MTYAVVNDADSVIVNIVAWDGETEWSPPDGTSAVADPDRQAIIGGTHDQDGFHPPA